ncbi:MAG: P22 phage major capsid protein family protein [Coriobacteriia bacterium]
MANTFLTPSIIAREALIALENNLVAAGLVHRDYSPEFAQVGEVITIKKPATFTAGAYNGSTVTKQNATEGSTTVTLDKHMDVSFAVTSKELSLSIKDFRTQLIDPAMRAHAQAIDAAICALYKDVPYTSRSGDTTAWTSLKALTAARKVLNDNKVPGDNRKALLGTTADAALLGLDAVVNAEKSGSTDALRNASLGKLIGFETFMDQNVADHVAGTGTTAGKVLVDLVDGYNVGATEIHVDAVATALKVGDAITIAGVPHVITVASALSIADQDITIAPALTAALANDAEILLVGDAEENIAFHKNAFALVTRPLAAPMGASKVEVLNWNGISIRVVYDYDMDLKSDVVSLDCLWGVKTLTRELACRAHG